MKLCIFLLLKIYTQAYIEADSNMELIVQYYEWEQRNRFAFVQPLNTKCLIVTYSTETEMLIISVSVFHIIKVKEV